MILKNILFDLDGTLTDPMEGVVRCYQYALGRMNHTCPAPEELACFIGPPIRQTFRQILHSTDQGLIEDAVAIYRERFAAIGLYENRVYPGVPEMLFVLRANGHRLFVATSKPLVYAEKVLRHFSLSSHFTGVQGNELCGRLDDKAELVEELITKHRLQAGETLMVGDRWHDVVAARRNKLRSMGVTYGYGSGEELVAAGADYIAHSPKCIEELVEREVRKGV